MKKSVIGLFCLSFVVLSIVGFSFFVSATDYSGDGTYTVKVGDNILLDNGWKINIIGLGNSVGTGDTITFSYYDDKGILQGERVFLPSFEGERKFGNSTVARIQMKLVGLSGAMPVTDWHFQSYTDAEISISSINEIFPDVANDVSIGITDMSKQLVYHSGEIRTLDKEDNLTLATGYQLSFDGCQSGGTPSCHFILYDSKDKLVDDIYTATEYQESLPLFPEHLGHFVGSYFTVMNSSDVSVTFNIINGSRITFGNFGGNTNYDVDPVTVTGWNLFSIPVEDGDGFGTILESTCNDTNTVWTWDNKLKEYKAIGSLKPGTLLPANTGLWVKVETSAVITEDVCSILVSGVKPVTTNGQKLSAGWNSIGAPMTSAGYRTYNPMNSSMSFLNYNNVLGDCDIESGPWQYLSTSYIGPFGQNSFYSSEGTVLPFGHFSSLFKDYLNLNVGYFIKVKDDCTLSDI